MFLTLLFLITEVEYLEELNDFVSDNEDTVCIVQKTNSIKKLVILLYDILILIFINSITKISLFYVTGTN